MCLAVPSKIVELTGQDAVVEVDGVRRRCKTSFLPDLQVGDHVLVHAGFAIQKWSDADLREWQEVMGIIESGGAPVA